MDAIISSLAAALEGRYRIEGELGAGGMSTVYLAVDERFDRRVALKVLHPDLAAAVAGQRFLSEITTTANLQHPHILPLFDSGEAGGFLYYVMPYVEGDSLRDKLDREGELSVAEALRIASDLAEALDYAHRQGVVHRDIKPENVLLHDGQAVISDFGIALAVDAAGGTRVTGTGQSVGTPYYMSPEQATPSGGVDGRSDVYSLACVLHEMLAGEPVFTGPTARVVLAKHLTVDPVPVRKLRSSVPRRVEDAILRALEKSPADRFSTMEDFAEALDRAVPPAMSPRGLWDGVSDWVRAHPFATTAVALMLVGTVVVGAPFVSGPAWTERPASVAVLPFREATSTDDEVGLAVELADRISRELMRWEGVSVATPVDLAGPRGDMGLTELALERIGDGAALADAVDAEAMLAVTVRESGDALSLQASLFDTRTRRRVGEPVMAGGSLEDVSSARLMAPVLARLLALDDAPDPARAIGAGTGSPEAAEAYLRGRDALERNQLDEAEAMLGRAIELDSTFASALSFLGQVHFWRGVEAGYYFLSRGNQISGLSTASMGHLQGLAPVNEAHVRGFYNLQVGAFDDAREEYRAIARADSSDVYALVMLGEIELLDPWSVRNADGDLVARSNLNRAHRAFTSAVSIDPTFELAYGQIFAIQQELEGALRGSCDGFEELAEELRPIWQRRVPTERMYPLCPVALDSLQWVPYAEHTAADRSSMRTGVDRYFRQAVGELERWASFAPDQPRPLELLSQAYLVQRRQLGVEAPERHRMLAAEALRYRSEAIALQADTSLTDLAALANLEMAVGNLEAAVDLARFTLSELGSAGSDEGVEPPPELVNVLIVSGQVGAALEMVSRLELRSAIPARYVDNPAGGRAIPIAGAEHAMYALRVLGASGVMGRLVQEWLGRLGASWASQGLSEPERQVVRDRATRDILATLAFDSVALARWTATSTLDDPLWTALSLSRTDAASAADAFAEVERRPSDLERPVPVFALAIAAANLGRDERAVALLNRLDSIPARVNGFEAGWGLQVLSHFLRAEHYERLGNEAAAVRHYQAFLAARSWPDSLSLARVEEARERVGLATGS